MGIRLEHKIPWEVVKNFAQECSRDDLWVTLTFYCKVQFAFWSFAWEEFKFMEHVNNFGAKIKNYSLINEHINNFFFAIEVLIIL